MDLYEAIAKRRSVRAFERKPIEQGKLSRVLEAARLAPSARNRQSWKLIVVGDPATRNALAEASEQAFLAKAPVVLAMVGLTPDATMSCGVPTDPVDCAIALEHVALAAAAEGLGTCWIGHFDQNKCREILKVPAGAKIVDMMLLGYPADEPAQRPRKPLNELVAFESYK